MTKPSSGKRKRPVRAVPPAQAEPPKSGRNGNSPDPPEREVRSRTPLFNISIIVTVATLLFVVALVALFLFRSALFGSSFFPVTLHNDGTAAVVVRGCGTNCTGGDVPFLLNPGKSVQVAANSTGEVTFYLHAASTAGGGAVIGCLPLEFTRKISGVTIQTSQAEACPGTPLPVPAGR